MFQILESVWMLFLVVGQYLSTPKWLHLGWNHWLHLWMLKDRLWYWKVHEAR